MADDDDDTGTNDDGPDDSGSDDWTPPSREQYEALVAKLGRTSAEAKDYRLKLKAERDKAAGRSSSPPASAGPVDLEAERQKWENESKSRVNQQIIRERARTALTAAGLTIPEGQEADAVISRAVRMMDLDTCELNDSGKVTGLDSEIETLKAQYPGMFRTQRRASAGVDGGTAGRSGSRDSTTTGAKSSSASRLAARWSNGGRD